MGCECLGNVFLNPFPAVGLLSRFSHVRLCVTLWAVANQAPLSMGLSRQEHWSGLPCPPPGDFPTGDRVRVSRVGRRVLYH